VRRRQAHRTRFAACVQLATCQRKRAQHLAGGADRIHFAMSRRIVGGGNGVRSLADNPAVTHDDSTERAALRVLHVFRRERNRTPQKLGIWYAGHQKSALLPGTAKVKDSMAQAFRSTRVVTSQGLVPATLMVEQGRIVEVSSRNSAPEDTEVQDFGDLVLLPGLVDSHVHINEPGRSEWEGFWTATRAAASGGVTTLIDMPLNCAPETITPAALEAKRDAAHGKAWVDWAAWGGVVRGNAEEIEPLAAAGVCGFKCFMIHSGIDGFAWVDEKDLRKALDRLRGTGLPLLAHAEIAGPVDAATQNLNAAHADWRKYETYLASRPGDAEFHAIALLIQLAEEFGTPIHIVHLSSTEALPMIAEARQRGVPITVETCTHYLWFSAEEIPDGATEFKCAPPIRDRDNREGLWQALVDGVIDLVTTDHSPCPPEMKQCQEGRWDKAWGGIASLGLALPVLWTGMKRCELTVEHVAEWLARRPACLAGLTGTKGELSVGADADFAVFDPDAVWTVSPEDLHFHHKLSPYLGAKLRGRVQETWLRGTCVFRNGHFIGEPRGRERVKR
jgi:allantoinase